MIQPIDDRWVQGFCDYVLPLIVDSVQPEQVILFGSRVTGLADDESDLGIIFVSEILESIPMSKEHPLLLVEYDLEDISICSATRLMN